MLSRGWKQSQCASHAQWPCYSQTCSPSGQILWKYQQNKQIRTGQFGFGWLTVGQKTTNKFRSRNFQLQETWSQNFQLWMETPSISRTQDNVVMLCVQRGENNDFVVNNACITRNTQARGTGVRNKRSNKKQKKDVDTAHLKIVLSTTLNASITALHGQGCCFFQSSGWKIVW